MANARRTLWAGFTTVRNLGLFVPTGGLAPRRRPEAGPSTSAGSTAHAVVPAGHAITPTGGHLDPTMFQALAPHIMPLTVEEGVADGVAADPTGRPLPDQARGGAHQVLRLGRGDVAHRPGRTQQYSDEELAVIADEAHRAGMRVAAHAHGDPGIRAAIEAGIDCIEPGTSSATRPWTCWSSEAASWSPPPTWPTGMDVSRAAPRDPAKAAEVFPTGQGKPGVKAIAHGASIACGTDAPAIPHGRNAEELIALVDRGMAPLEAIRAATTVSAELIDRGRPGSPGGGGSWPTSSPCPATPGRHHADRAGELRDEGRPDLPQRPRLTTGRPAPLRQLSVPAAVPIPR